MLTRKSILYIYNTICRSNTKLLAPNYRRNTKILDTHKCCLMVFYWKELTLLSSFCEEALLGVESLEEGFIKDFGMWLSSCAQCYWGWDKKIQTSQKSTRRRPTQAKKVVGIVVTIAVAVMPHAIAIGLADIAIAMPAREIATTHGVAAIATPWQFP